MGSQMRTGGKQIDVHGGPPYDDPEGWSDLRYAAELFRGNEIPDASAGIDRGRPGRVVGVSGTKYLVVTRVSKCNYGEILRGSAVDIEAGVITERHVLVDVVINDGDLWDEVDEARLAPELVQRVRHIALGPAASK